MGIEDFSVFLKDRAPNCYSELPLEAFRGKRLAVDMHNLIYQMVSVSTNDVLYVFKGTSEVDQSTIERLATDKILNRLEVFLSYGATPVCVFDGKSHPLKSRPGNKRAKNRETLRMKLQAAHDQLFGVDPLLRTQALIENYRKYRKQAVEVSQTFIAQIKEVLSTAGFPVVLAESFKLITNDAEGICASLCLSGNDYCHAGVTEDSDFHVYGGNVQIVEIYQKKVEGDVEYFAKVRSLEHILAQSGLTFVQFRDLCIMLGTDFNDRIPGVGPKTCWDRLVQWGGVQGWARADPSVLTRLNYHQVLDIFNSTLTKINIDPPLFNLSLLKERGRDVFDAYGLKDHTNYLFDLVSQLGELRVEKSPALAEQNAPSGLVL